MVTAATLREFRRVGVLNRGEPAVRFIRALREYNLERGLDLVAVAFYSDVDARAPFVQMAHEEYALGAVVSQGPRGSRNVYVDHDRLLGALRATKCDAVWPGWGFVSEDAEFVAKLEAEGIVFLGPSSEAMRRLGDKIEAKRLAEACGVPLAPWWAVEDAGDVARFEQEAARIGFPLMVKASGGGGGRGIRRVEGMAGLASALKVAAEEVKNIFGQGGLLMESCVTAARHIEVQLVVGADGEASAVGVRDCTIQRRHQKIVEEAPSPVLPAEVGRLLCETSAQMAAAAGYRGVATAEFLYEPGSGRCVFLEVNSRLQVEHTVTELAHDCDLVKAQIDIARGLPWEKPWGDARGHAIEVRVNAEDPDRGFLPSPGVVRVFRTPSGPGVRVDSGVMEGQAIAPEFDSMIAKVIAWAPTRRQAIARLTRALQEFEIVIEDGATNKAFLIELLAHEAMTEAKATTAWLDVAMVSGAFRPPVHQFKALVAAAILEYRRERVVQVQRFFAESQNGIPQQVPPPAPLEIALRLRGRDYNFLVHGQGEERYLVGPPEALHQARWEVTGDHSAYLYIDVEGARRARAGESRRVRVLHSYGRSGMSVEVDGAAHTVERATGGVVQASAPAVVVHVAVQEGDRVQAGDRLCTLEAMKMEMGVFAATGGVVRAILCRPNQQVAAGQHLLVLEPDQSAPREGAGAGRIEAPSPSRGALDVLFEGGKAQVEVMDRLGEAEAAAVVEGLGWAVRSILCGGDVAQGEAQRLERLLGAEQDFAMLRRPERWAGLASLLGCFADVEGLFDRDSALVLGVASSSTVDQAFYEFCRRHHEGEEGAAPELRPRLLRALGWYGVRSLEPSPALREALWRMAVAYHEGGLRHRLASGLLRLVMQLHEGGARFWSELEKVLESVARVARPEWLFVRDNAEQARYVLFEQGAWAQRSQALEGMLERALGEALVSRSGAMAALARSTMSILPVLVGRSGGEEGESVLEAIVRRLYVGRRFEVLEALSLGSGAGLAGRLDDGTWLRATACLEGRLEGALAELRGSGAEALGAVEVILCGEGILADVGAWGKALDGSGLGAKRVTLTWRGRRHTHHRTFKRGAEGSLQEDGRLRDVHPEAAARLELARLDAFVLETLEAPERLHAFAARARENERDERVFLAAEVEKGPAVQLEGPCEALKEELAQVYAEGVRVLRSAQAHRPPQRRFHWNQLSIFVRPQVALTQKDVADLALRFEAPNQQLGLRHVVLRVRLPDPAGGEGRATEFFIRRVGEHRIEVEQRAPDVRPVRALRAYETRAVQARRLGCIFPYEVLWLFQGRAATDGQGEVGAVAPHPDMERGHVQEYDLDERGVLVPVSRPYGENKAGVVVAVVTNHSAKFPEGMSRVWIGSDPTMSMGSLAEPECRRIIAALDLAQARGLPVEWLPISAGARIAMDSGTENLDWTAHVLRRIIEFTQDGGEIHVIVSGVNVGAQSYWNAEATMLMHCKGALIMTRQGSMVLTGKKALEFSGGVSAQDERGIGGFDRIMGPNGQAQYYAQDVGEAYSILFEYYRFAYRLPGEARPRRAPTTDRADRSVMGHPVEGSAEFRSVGEILSSASNAERKKPFPIRAVMQAVVDQDGGFLERFGALRDGEHAVVWDAHLGGYPVTLIGIESQPMPRRGPVPMDGPSSWTGGTLFPQSSRKVARALNAASGSRPVVVLANLSGFDGSPESLRKLQLEYGAEIGRAVVNFKGPIIFVVVGRYHGGAYVVFSKALNAGLRSLALEGTYASVIGGAPAAAVVFPQVVRARVERDPRIVAAREALAQAEQDRLPGLREALDALTTDVMLEKRGELAREFDAIHSVERAVMVGSLDRIIRPEELRSALIEEVARGW